MRLFACASSWPAPGLVGHLLRRCIPNVGDLDAYAAVVSRSPWVSLRGLVWLLMGENIGEVLFATAFVIVVPWQQMAKRSLRP